MNCLKLPEELEFRAGELIMAQFLCTLAAYSAFLVQL